MRERPILFSAPMVRAILDGRKTQTRRIVKLQPSSRADIGHYGASMPFIRNPDVTGKNLGCPYGQPGDRIWVRETHAIFQTHGQHRDDGQRWGPWGGLPTTVSEDGKQIAYYREGFDRCDPGPWRPSIHMPRWASRITLEITGVRVERLQFITEADAMAEGAEPILVPPDGGSCPYYEGFRELWGRINGPSSWDANPWVWVVEFKRVDAQGGPNG